MPIEIRKQDGAIDEVVASGVSVHLERCRSDMWFLDIMREDGSSLAIWLSVEKRSIRISTEEREPPACRSPKPDP